MTEDEQISLVSALRERGLGEKHAYLDGYVAGIRQMQRTASGLQDADIWLQVIQDIRDSLPPR